MFKVRSGVDGFPKARRAGAVALAGLFLLPSTAAMSADAEYKDIEPLSCVTTRQIRSTKVIDNQTIILRMIGKRLVRMKLRYECHSLKFHEMFYYETSTGRLCSRVDWITARSGSTCPIESFTLVEKEKEDKGKESKPAAERGR